MKTHPGIERLALLLVAVVGNDASGRPVRASAAVHERRSRRFRKQPGQHAGPDRNVGGPAGLQAEVALTTSCPWEEATAAPG